MNDKPIIIELYYTFTCPNCSALKRILDEVLPNYGNKFILKKHNASSPFVMFKTMRLGIHAVPTLLIDSKIVFRSLPTKEELINILNNY